MFRRDSATEPSGARPGTPPKAGHADDRRLVEAALGGDAQGLDRLIQRLACVPRFLAALDRRTASPLGSQALSDVAQDVLAIVWRRLPDFRGDASLETWTFRVCDLELRNAQRRARRSTLSITEVAEPEAATIQGLFDAEQMVSGLATLAPEESAVIRLKHYEGLTFDEIARTLGLSPNTAKTRYYRGLEALRRWFRRAEER